MLFIIINKDYKNFNSNQQLRHRLCNIAMYTISMCLLFFLLFTMVIVLMPSSSLPLSLSSNLNHSDLLNDSSSSSVNKSKINIDDIFITVKTTRIFHKSRLDIILDTWYTLAKNQVS